MKPSISETNDAVLRHTEAQLEASILSLFGGFPSLCGFSVQERSEGSAATLEGGLYLAAVGLYPLPGVDETKLIYEEIRLTLIELLDERPEARALLSGRTFARALH
jgi:hypothetical protein